MDVHLIDSSIFVALGTFNAPLRRESETVRRCGVLAVVGFVRIRQTSAMKRTVSDRARYLRGSRNART